MNVAPQKMRYDVAKTVFSPDGRLYQVEYAREAVKKGATALGVVYESGMVLAAVKQTPSLQVEGLDKLFQIDDHAAVVTAGLVSDGRNLVDQARQEAQKNRLLYEEPIPTGVLAKFLADQKQMFTQYGGVRPYGVAMLVGGHADNPELYQTDPSGILKQWKVIAIGRGADPANALFEKEYKKGMDREEAIQLALKALGEGEEKLSIGDVELATLDADGFTVFEPDTLKDIMSEE